MGLAGGRFKEGEGGEKYLMSLADLRWGWGIWKVGGGNSLMDGRTMGERCGDARVGDYPRPFRTDFGSPPQGYRGV